jgi:Haem-binding domain/Cytochrome P460
MNADDSTESGTLVRAGVFIAVVILAIFVAIQFLRPNLTNPPVTADLDAPPEVRQILHNSCYNCHSNETNLPWFDKIAPAYWVVAHDVRQARMRLNFSEIGKLPPAQQRALLFEAVNQIQLGAMPLKSYTLIHPNAKVSADDLETLKHYLNPTTTLPQPNPAATAFADQQYNEWIHTPPPPRTPPPSPNGIEYIPDWKYWKAISSTNRFDNKTLRVIFGNDIAVRAIANHHTNPWPDGTILAKTAWQQMVDENGETKTGAFIQVEFMIKGAKKYASTQGWGFARFRGGTLRPFGANASFVNECTGCHAPMRKNDFVFTFPIEGQQ